MGSSIRASGTTDMMRVSTLLSLMVLCLIAIACLIGPWLLPHSYARVFRDYVLIGPSLAVHPTPEERDLALAEIKKEIHPRQTAYEMHGTTMHLTLEGDAPFDHRLTRFFERSDVFGPAKIVGEEAGGKRLTLELPVQQTYFFFGTDANGRDLLTRTLVAGRISLAVALLASLMALVLGVGWGATAGYLGGRADAMMMRLVEIIYALPFVFLVILLVVLFGRNFVLIFVAIGAVEWLDMARIVRGQTLSLKRRDYVAAAEAFGESAPQILRTHIIPNAAGPIIAYLSILVPRVILLESFVSFLGLGVQEPLASWGILIADGARNVQASVHLLIFPALFLGLTLAAFDHLGTRWRETLGVGGA